MTIFENLIGNDHHQAYSLPFLSYPTKLDCFGLKPVNPSAVIEEGYIIMANDFKITEADSKCIFSSFSN
jgi:hypothetical protein